MRVNTNKYFLNLFLTWLACFLCGLQGQGILIENHSKSNINIDNFSAIQQEFLEQTLKAIVKNKNDRKKKNNQNNNDDDNPRIQKALSSVEGTWAQKSGGPYGGGSNLHLSISNTKVIMHDIPSGYIRTFFLSTIQEIPSPQGTYSVYAILIEYTLDGYTKSPILISLENSLLKTVRCTNKSTTSAFWQRV